MKGTVVYASTSCFQDKDLSTIIQTSERAGIHAIELSAITGYSLTTLTRAARSLALVLHNYFPPPDTPTLLNIASQDEAIRQSTVAFYKRAIDISASVGSRIYGIHAGFSVDIPPSLLGRPREQRALTSGQMPDPEILYNTIRHSVVELVQYSRDRKVTLLVENHAMSPLAGPQARGFLPMVESRDLCRLAKDISDPHFGLLLDVGHAKVSATACGFSLDDFVSDLAQHVKALHLSDNDGQEDTNGPFTKNSWFMPHLRKFSHLPMTLELAPTTTRQIIEHRRLVLGAL